jgi:NAD-dependent dihydropyrimidine dehydrogenase PreA subunit
LNVFKPFLFDITFLFYSSVFNENPIKEGIKMVKIIIDNDKCTGCGTCVETCPVDVLEIQNEKSVPVKVEECLVCRACEAQCPENAIQIIE